MTKAFRELGILLKETAIEWIEDDIPARGAALSYYVLLSLGPALVLIVGLLELLIGEADIRAGVIESIREGVGGRAAETAAMVLQQVEVPDLYGLHSLAAVFLLLFGATAAFANVRGSLDKIWGLGPEDASRKVLIVGALKGRARGILMILLTGLVLTVSFTLTSVIGLVSDALESALPLGGNAVVRGLEVLVSFLFTGMLFAAIFRTLPSVRIAWRTVWIGAFVTALFFVMGESIVARLIANATWTTYYGPGASAVAFLAWIYFSAQVFFFGAEFTQVWARRRGYVLGGKSRPTGE